MRNLLLILIVTVFAGCDSSPLVRSVGAYDSPNGKWIVTISRRPKSLIDYAITDAKTGNELVQAGGFSDVMRWFLLWDDENRLWAWDSDTGGFGYWSHSGDAGFKFTKFEHDDDPTGIPSDVAENRPSTVKRLFGIDS